MFRFSIRDLFWAILVVAMGLGWGLHYRAVEAKRQEAIRGAQNVVDHAKKLKQVLGMAQNESDQLKKDVRFFSDAAWKNGASISYLSARYNVNWKVLDEPIPPLE